MPHKLVQVQPGHYAVVNTETHKFSAKDTTEEKAKKQMRLLEAIHHGMKPGSYGRVHG